MTAIPVSCTVNEDMTIGLATIPENMRVRLKGLLFQFTQESPDYSLTFFPNGQGFSFDNDLGPIVWGEGGQPTWLTLVPHPDNENLLELANDSSSIGTASFQILNASGPSVSITIQNLGGDAGAGGTIGCALKEDGAGIVNPLPAGVSVAGTDVAFGLIPVEIMPQELEFAFEFTPTGSVTFNMPTERPGLVWQPPENVSAVQVESDGITFTAKVFDARWKALFTIHTNLGGIDPTIVGDPEVGGPFDPVRW